MNVTRYDVVGNDFELEVSSNGDFVDSSDYEDLQEQLDTLQNKYDNLVKEIGWLVSGA